MSLRLACVVVMTMMGSAIAVVGYAEARQVPVVRNYGEGDTPRERWRVETRPRTVIGSEDAMGPDLFQMVHTVQPVGNGAFAVADGDAAEIRMFDREGRHLRTMGRHGRGPGEFGAIWGLWRIGDSLAAMDEVGVLQMFTLEGRHVRTVQRPTALGFRVVRSGFLRNGSAIGFVTDPPDSVPIGKHESFVTFLRIDPDGTQHQLGRYHGVQVIREGSAPRFKAVVYGPRLVTAVLSDRVCLGFPSEGYQFRCLDADGRTIVTVSRRTATVRVTEAHRQGYFHLMDSANSLPRNAEYRRRLRITTVFADRFPPYGRFVNSTTDELWVGPMDPGDWGTFPNPVPPEPTVWSVYSKEGEWLSDVTLPAWFRLLAVDQESVIGLLRHPDDGIEKIAVYPLVRR